MNATNLLNWLRTLLHRASPAGLIWLTLCLGLGAALVQADGPNRVALVVAYDDTIVTQCVEFPEDEISGYEVLNRSGLDLNANVSGGMGAAICSIDGQGCSFPAEDCFCQCQASCVFWSYWHLADNEWVFSALGATNRKVGHGQVEGWAWGEGSPGGAGAKPPLVDFAEICTALPTATPIPSPTATPTPLPPTSTFTPTPLPTSTPAPTKTPEPEPTPIIQHFTADRTIITAGEGVTLSWDVSKAEVAYLRYDGVEQGVVAPGSVTLFPTQTTQYALVARKDDSQAVLEMTITVNPAPTPTVTQPAPIQPTDAPPIAVPATATLLPPTLPAATVTPIPPTATPAVGEPIITFEAAALIVPAGTCTALKWQTEQATAVYLDGVAVDLEGNYSACPTQTQAYTLRAVGSGGEREAHLTLQVTAPVASLVAAVTLTATPLPVTEATLGPLERNSADEGPRRFAVLENEDGGDQLLVYSGLFLAVLLFLIAPIALLALGWIVWWVRKQ